MAAVLCPEGHYYEEDKFFQCPYCGIDIRVQINNNKNVSKESEGVDYVKTLLLAKEDVDKTLLLSGDDDKTLLILNADEDKTMLITDVDEDKTMLMLNMGDDRALVEENVKHSDKSVITGGHEGKTSLLTRKIGLKLFNRRKIK